MLSMLHKLIQLPLSFNSQQTMAITHKRKLRHFKATLMSSHKTRKMRSNDVKLLFAIALSLPRFSVDFLNWECKYIEQVNFRISCYLLLMFFRVMRMPRPTPTRRDSQKKGANEARTQNPSTRNSRVLRVHKQSIVNT